MLCLLVKCVLGKLDLLFSPCDCIAQGVSCSLMSVISCCFLHFDYCVVLLKLGFFFQHTLTVSL